MLNKLREINERLIILYKTEQEKIKKQKLIKILLANNKCFFKIDMDTAISILKDLLKSKATIVFIAHNFSEKMQSMFDREIKLQK